MKKVIKAVLILISTLVFPLKGNASPTMDGINFSQINFYYRYCITNNYESGAGVAGLRNSVDPNKFRAVRFDSGILAGGSRYSDTGRVFYDGRIEDRLPCIPFREISKGQKFKMEFVSLNNKIVTIMFEANWHYPQSAISIDKLNLQIVR